MAWTITIDGADHTDDIYRPVGGSAFQLTMALGSQWELAFSTKDKLGTSSAYRPAINDAVVLSDGGTTRFSGKIFSLADGPIEGTGSGTLTRVVARAQIELTDQVGDIVAEYAAGFTLKQIVTDLASDWLTDVGLGSAVDAGMASGPTMSALTFDHVSFAGAMNYLSTITGWVWRLTPAGVIEMFSVGTKTAAFSLTAANKKSVGPITWEQTSGVRVNRATLVYGSTQQILKTQTITGDGVSTEWALDYDSVRNTDNYILSAGYVTDDGVFSPLSPYPGGSTNWQYDPTTNHLLRTGGALPNGDVATFVYLVQFPQTVTVEDSSDITSNGLWARTFTNDKIFDIDEATDFADGLLTRFTDVPMRVTSATREGFELPGTVMTLAFTDRVISSAAYLITNVSAQDGGRADWEYTYTLLSGTAAQRSWTDALRDSLSGGSITGGASGTVIPNASGLFDNDVVAHSGFSDGTTGYESALTTYTNSAGEGAALRLGRNDQDWRWVIVADADYGSSPGTVGRLRFQLPTIGSAISAVFQVVDDGSDNYVLLPGEGLAALGGFWIGDPAGLITGASPDNKIAGIYTDILKATDGVYERGRTVRQGDWTTVAFSAGNFTASGSMTWTVASGDQITYQYMLVGSTMFVKAVIDTSTVGGTLDTLLKIAIPGGFTAVAKATFGAKIRDNNVVTSGFAQVLASGTTIDIGRDDNAAFSASTDLTYVRVSMFFEVQ